MLKSRVIKNLTISAPFLSAFLERILQGLCPAGVFRELGTMSRTNIYRIYHRFRHSQTHIRTYLSRIKGPPDLNSIKDPVVQTIVHLRSVFKECVVSQFQYYFQTSFL